MLLKQARSCLAALTLKYARRANTSCSICMCGFALSGPSRAPVPGSGACPASNITWRIHRIKITRIQQVGAKTHLPGVVTRWSHWRQGPGWDTTWCSLRTRAGSCLPASNFEEKKHQKPNAQGLAARGLISLRLSEALDNGKKLQAALPAAGVSTFPSSVHDGGNIAEEVSRQICGADCSFSSFPHRRIPRLALALPGAHGARQADPDKAVDGDPERRRRRGVRRGRCPKDRVLPHVAGECVRDVVDSGGQPLCVVCGSDIILALGSCWPCWTTMRG